MKTIIAGGRNYRLTAEDIRLLDQLPITEVISGCASGADLGGEQYAKSRGIPITRFPADWNKHGKAAGPIRNQQMAEYAEAAIIFPGGRGSADMTRKAIEHGLVVHSVSGD